MSSFLFLHSQVSPPPQRKPLRLIKQHLNANDLRHSHTHTRFHFINHHFAQYCYAATIDVAAQLSPGIFILSRFCVENSNSADLSSLLPCAVDTDERRDSSGKTDKSIIEAGVAEGRGWNGQVAKVGKKLELDGSALPISC